MINPQIQTLTTFLNILQLNYNSKDIDDIEQLFVQYEGDQPSILTYTSEINEKTDSFEGDEQIITLDNLCRICTFLTDMHFTVGTDFQSIYCEHRHVKQLRAIIPQDHILIIYDDESADIDFSKSFTEKIRSCFTIE